MARDYADDFQKILEQLSVEDVQGTETPAKDLLELNMSDSKGRRFNAAHLRGALRAGEAAGYGSLIVGRRGYPTRFAWSKVPSPPAASKRKSASAKASKAPAKAPKAAAPVAPEPAPAPAPEPTQANTVQHSLRLRPDLTVQVELPADLNAREAERLAHWMQALPYG